MKFVLACDESGAKGHSSRREAFPGEVGVFAGILVPADQLPVIEPFFQAIHDAHASAVDKLHVTNLADRQQHAMRTELFDAIARFELPCFWYAIHVDGFHAHHSFTQSILDESRAKLVEHHGPNGPRVRRGSPRAVSSSLHVQLFAGMYTHALAFLEERHPGPSGFVVDLEVRTDRVDVPLATEFRTEALRLLDVSPKVWSSTGFDTVTKEVVRGEIRSEVTYPPELVLRIEVRELSITPTIGDGLVLAADVIANSLNHLFRGRAGDALYADLNRPEAIEGHPLALNLDSFWCWGSADVVGDRLYRHPKAPPRSRP